MRSLRQTLRVTLAFTVVAAAGPTAKAAEPGLVAHWKLDEREGKKVIDSSGNGYHGTAEGGAEWQPDTGRIGGALKCGRGGADCGTVPGSAPAMTVALWVKATNKSRDLVGKSPNDKTEKGWKIRISNGSAEAEIGSARSYTKLSSGRTQFRSGEWAHLACTFDQSTAKIYINAVQVASRSGITQTVENSATPLQLCRSDAVLDDVRIYDRALSPNEIAALLREVEAQDTLVLQRLDRALREGTLLPREAIRGHRRKAEIYEARSDFDAAISECEAIIRLAGSDERLVEHMIHSVRDAHLKARRVQEAASYLENTSQKVVSVTNKFH